MNVEQAILILKDYINVDRQIRNHKIESDYEQFCEINCRAIETLIETIENEK